MSGTIPGATNPGVANPGGVNTGGWLPYASVGSNFFGNLLQYIGNRETNTTNMKLAREAQAFEKLMWDMQNAYNSPLAQMERYKAAGLNPNLIYGSGSPSAGNANTSVKATVPQYQNPLSGMKFINLMDTLLQFQTLKKEQALTHNIETVSDLNAQKKLNEEMKNLLLGVDQKIKNLSFDTQTQLQPYQIQLKEREVQKMNQQIDQLIWKNTVFQPQYAKGQEADVFLKQMNAAYMKRFQGGDVMPNDPFYVKYLKLKWQRLLEALGREGYDNERKFNWLESPE